MLKSDIAMTHESSRPFIPATSPQEETHPLKAVVKPANSLEERLLLALLLLNISDITTNSKAVVRARVQRGRVKLVRRQQQRLNLGAARGQQHAVVLGVRERDGAGDGADLRVLQQAGVRGKGRVAALARGEEAEGVAPAPAVAGDGHLLDEWLAARVRDRLGDDRVLGHRVVRADEGAHVHLAEVDVGAERAAVEHVRGDGEVAGAGEAVGEAAGGC